MKTDLMPDFDFDAFNHEDAPSSGDGDYNDTPETVAAPIAVAAAPAPTPAPAAPVEEVPAASGDNLANEEVDKW